MTTYYLDVTESLAAAGDAELRSMLAPLGGDTVYLVTWTDQANERQHGYASAASAAAAKRICRAHERGYGRDATNLIARKWGTKADLADVVTARCAPRHPSMSC